METEKGRGQLLQNVHDAWGRKRGKLEAQRHSVTKDVGMDVVHV